MTGIDVPAREVAVGDLVIYTQQSGVYRYAGPSDDPRFWTIEFSYSKQHHGVRCDPSQVAPVGTPIPESSDRVKVVKQDRDKVPFGSAGPWQLLSGGSPRFFRTKRDAMDLGLRTVAIEAWHAAGPAAGPVDGRRQAAADLAAACAAALSTR